MWADPSAPHRDPVQSGYAPEQSQAQTVLAHPLGSVGHMIKTNAVSQYQRKAVCTAPHCQTLSSLRACTSSGGAGTETMTSSSTRAGSRAVGRGSRVTGSLSNISCSSGSKPRIPVGPASSWKRHRKCCCRAPTAWEKARVYSTAKWHQMMPGCTSNDALSHRARPRRFDPPFSGVWRTPVLVIRESITKEYGSRVFHSSPCGPLFLHIEPNQLSLRAHPATSPVHTRSRCSCHVVHVADIRTT